MYGSSLVENKLATADLNNSKCETHYSSLKIADQ
jgi:hypothetical protein